MKMKICDNCDYLILDKEFFFNSMCRRNPPVIVPENGKHMHNNYEQVLPKVSPGCYCGEWKKSKRRKYYEKQNNKGVKRWNKKNK